MKLTPRAQGYRFTREDWEAGCYVDVRRVGRSIVEAINEKGKAVTFDRDEMDRGWVRIGSTENCTREVS